MGRSSLMMAFCHMVAFAHAHVKIMLTTKKKNPPSQKQRRKKTMEGSLPEGSSLKVYVFIG